MGADDPAATRALLPPQAEGELSGIPAALVRMLAARGHAPDSSQMAAAGRLEQLHAEWVDFKARRSNAVTRLLVRPPIPRGVYLWGGVGRGKSLLMDSFFAAAPVVRKTRVHFHEFMREVHRELDAVRGEPDPLDEVGLRLARRSRLICFDEFHVSDIADAMILHRLLARLFDLRVGFVMTSNVPPSGLYPEGLHRDRILPAIALLEERLDVLQVDGGTDYRLRALERLPTYLVPADAAALESLARAFDALAEVPDEDPHLLIEDREIRARRRAGGTVWFDFSVLCGGPRSQNDYLEIAMQFHTVVVSGIPRMSAGQSSEARRFTWLVDILYDHRVNLLVSAAVAPHELYQAGALAREFERAASRLVEMQSTEYQALARAKAGGGAAGVPQSPGSRT
jgi:cell division protein ZapE